MENCPRLKIEVPPTAFQSEALTLTPMLTLTSDVDLHTHESYGHYPHTCVVPRTLSSYGDRTFAAAGTRLWNSLPVSGVTIGRARRAVHAGPLQPCYATAPGPAAQPSHHSRTVPTTTEETSFSGSMNAALCDLRYVAP